MVHGTGRDLWRDLRADGSAYLAEVRHLEVGKLHGFEWWIPEDQTSVFIERCWHQGRLHTIEREWGTEDRLNDDYPKCSVRGHQVSRETYRAMAAEAPAWPLFVKVRMRQNAGFPQSSSPRSA